MYSDFGTSYWDGGGYSNCHPRQVYILEDNINVMRNNCGFPSIDPERLGGYEQELRPDITEKSIYNLINDDVFEPIKPLKRRLTVRILLSIINMIKWVCRL